MATYKAIQICKCGVVLREYSTEFYTLNLMNGLPVILNKEDRSVVCLPSPHTYDYIEINETGESDD